MPETNVLDRLLAFGIDKGFFEEKLLGKLDKSCCPCSEVEVIDFDKAKKKIISDENQVLEQPANRQEPSSTDAVKIFPDKGQIDFIELKGFKKFILWNKENQNINKAIITTIGDFDLKAKIIDSLHILYDLVFDGSFRASNEEKNQYRCSTKNYFVVVDINLHQDPIKDRAVTLDFLSQNSNIEQKISKSLNQEINDIPESSLENLQKPRLFSCSEIDRHYNLTSQ